MTDQRLVLPSPVSAPVPWKFPVLAVAAPVVVSVALWLITGSIFALVFAALGPVTAVASVADQWWGGRRSARRDRVRFADAIATAHRELERFHAAEREGLRDATPDGPTLVRRRHDRGRWHGDPRAARVVLGTASIPSALEVTTPAGAAIDQPAEIVDLAQRARSLDGPLAVDSALGIGIVGPRAIAMACARGVVVQAARALPPGRFWVRVSSGARGSSGSDDWLQSLPHRRLDSTHRGGGRATLVVEFGSVEAGHATVTIAVADTEADIPPECRVVVSCEGAMRVVQHPDPAMRVPVKPGFVSAVEALAWAESLSDDPRARDAADPHGLPDVVPLGPLLGDPEPDESSLACQPVVGSAGPLTLDLVRDGPHSVVGGTTGSGKSELLVSWVIAMAARHPPERVCFLLVDFKGGSAFAPLAGLPHTVGTITDLDEHEAARALASLRAELRLRERTLAQAGARNIEECDLPRLVIVVDEFAAMLAEFPDLHALFTDLAARGRSLGVHLILCTQRPAGVVRDSVLANADLRISLRVNNRADSGAVVGVPDAAELDASARGRAIVRLAGGEALRAQVAIAAPDDIRDIARRWASSPAPRRPWRDPLSSHIDPRDLVPVGRGFPLGMVDLPEEQRQDTFAWDPSRAGGLLVLGAQRSGKSTVLAGIPGWRMPGDPPAAWDVLDDVVSRLDRPTDARDALQGVLTIDDIDALVPRFSQEHRAAWLESLTRLLRDGGALGIHVAVSAQQLQGELHSIASLLPARLMLRHGSRQDWVLAGGEGSEYLGSGPPGAGRWSGHRVQVAEFAMRQAKSIEPVVTRLDPTRPLAAVSTRGATLVPRLRDAGWTIVTPEAASVETVAAGMAVVGDVDEWQSRWGLLGSLRETCTVVLDGCSLADVRLLTRSRQLPPPLPSDRRAVWHFAADGTLTRARL